MIPFFLVLNKKHDKMKIRSFVFILKVEEDIDAYLNNILVFYKKMKSYIKEEIV